MMTLSRFAFCLLLAISHWPLALEAQRDYSSLVNPFIGTGGHGHTYPGASMPFGMMQLSPDTRMADWDGSSGYHYSDTVIYGFSHTHLSGTGIPDYCDLLFMPFTGENIWDKNEYRSSFSHKNEQASPGYYEVLLEKDKILAQLTTTTRAGMHKYVFPKAGVAGKLMIDLSHRDQLLDVFIEKLNDHELRGFRRSRSWAQDQQLFFHIRSEQPFYTETRNDSLNGKEVVTKMILSFIIPQDKQVLFKVGISGVSMEGAQLNLDHEIPGWDFSKIKEQAKQSWNKELSKIDVKGGTRDQQTIFYTALYHTFLAPNIYQDVNGLYRGTDKQIHKAGDFTNHSVFSLWDTYRAFHPLMTIINQHRTSDWIKTFLNQYKHGGMLPVWELSANETFCMIGYHSVPVIVDAYQKGIRDFDAVLALEAMRSYAESNRFGLDHYRERGFISNDQEHESVSKTLEYAYDDWCIAQMAKAMGQDSIYEMYTRRAQHYKNLFDPSAKHMRGKIGSNWHQPFDPKEINNFFTEGNSWQYSFAVPHDIKTLVNMHGGEASFVTKLSELFTTSSQTTGRQQADVTGLIGQYAHGNEPSHHMAYLFNYVGMPWKTQELVHRICNEFYRNEPAGLIGNEDCGQMSAWYIFSSMGFYPVNPANGEYATGTPVFDEIRIDLENGKTFIIKANRKSAISKYISGLKLNGEEYSFSYVKHDDVLKGGLLEFDLDDHAHMQWASLEKDRPRSVINDHLMIPVPYFDVNNYKFKKQTEVVIKGIDDSSDIYYRIIAPHIRTRFTQYERPFEISFSCTVEAFSTKGIDSSYIVYQDFHLVPHDHEIKILSEVHSIYTAGGSDALIDGVKGSTNWRAGEWQSYYGRDFEAIIDLKVKKNISYLGVHVLQDVSPWIIYPREVIFYSSEDGKEFSEISRIKNKVAVTMDSVQVQELGAAIHTKTRYIKVKAISGGQLPSWHESAGNASHLFISEIIVK